MSIANYFLIGKERERSFAPFIVFSAFTGSPGKDNKVDSPLDFEHNIFILVKLKNLFLLFHTILMLHVCSYSEHNDTINTYYYLFLLNYIRR